MRQCFQDYNDLNYSLLLIKGNRIQKTVKQIYRMLKEETKILKSLFTQLIISLTVSIPHQKARSELDFLPHPQTLSGPLMVPPLGLAICITTSLLNYSNSCLTASLPQAAPRHFLSPSAL